MFVVLCVVVVVVPPPCLASWSFLGVKYAALFFKSIFVAEKLSERSSPRGRYVYVWPQCMPLQHQREHTW